MSAWVTTRGGGLVAPGARVPTSNTLSTGVDVWVAAGSAPSTASVTPTAGVLHYVPYDVANALSITALAIEVVTGGSGGSPSVRLGVYGSDGQGWPGTLLQDAGLVAATAAGVIAVGGIAVSAAPGRYWLAVRLEGATITQPALRANGGAVTIPAATAAEAMASNGLRSSLTGQSGALPATASTAGAFSGTNLAPRVVVRTANTS